MNKIIENEKENYKFVCEKCNIGSNFESLYKRHLKSTKHTGVRAVRKDKKVLDKCPHCDYKINNTVGLQSHILNHHATKQERKDGFKFYCEKCDVGMFAEAYWKQHLKSKRHLGRE
jgi:hypothetical protein